MARRHGWSQAQLDRAWAIMEAVGQAESQIAQHDHPHLYEVEDGVVMFTGESGDPDDDGDYHCGWSS
jgi:hypothetical protein